MVVNAPRPLIPGQAAVCHLHATATPCTIARLEALLDTKTGAVKKSGPAFRVLLKDQVAVVELELEQEVCCEVAAGQSSLKRVVLRIGGVVVAVGALQDVVDAI